MSNIKFYILFFLLFKILSSSAQQFVNGKLIVKTKNPNYMPFSYYSKFGSKIRSLYSDSTTAFKCGNPDRNNLQYVSIEGLDTLKHGYCSYFIIEQNRVEAGGAFTKDSCTSVHLNFNGDTLSDFGFSLKLNSPLLKDSSYELTFLITSEKAYQKGQQFYNKHLDPCEDFKIKITQSSKSDEEGEEIAVISRSDIYEIDSSIYNFESFEPKTSPRFTLNNYYYVVRKKIKGANNGLYLSVKAKLIITDEVSTLFRYGLKPSKLNCDNLLYLNYGAHVTRFELKCPFEIKESGKLCNNSNPLILRSNNNHITDKYLWSTGDTTDFLIVRNPGLYWLKKDRNGCIWIDSIFINGSTEINSKYIYHKCKDSSLTIGRDSIFGQSMFMWNNGESKPFKIISDPGTYVRISNLNNCKSIDSFIVKENPKHKSIIYNRYTLCSKDSITLRSLLSNVEWYRKNSMFSNLKEIQIIGNRHDTIILKSFLECWQIDTIYVNSVQCGINLKDYIFIPNVFTPNDDGINDVFMVSSPLIDELEISIYNNWGELIYCSDNVKQGWDGTYNGKIVQNGEYLVKLKIKSNLNSDGFNPNFYLNTKITLLK